MTQHRDITLPCAGYAEWRFRIGRTVEGIAAGGSHRIRRRDEDVTRELTAAHRLAKLTTEQAPVAAAEDAEDVA
ncbi:hypothetical protein [Methylobacterium sp. CCH5-D2]|uniref:hypothetical protein n=1 Tax=Methylobacterium sp. CCH5-D2 TaxID=1768765 RepID=UPI00083328A8|nr:hypothetical protein [Methylobacterium sp. CCH5-D2]